MSGSQDYGRGAAIAVGSNPVNCSNTPAIAGKQSGEPVDRHRRGEVITDGALMLEELGGDNSANGVPATVFGAS